MLRPSPDSQPHSEPAPGCALRIAPDVWIAEDELSFRAIRASGPGGQRVNKVATAVQLRFDTRRSRGLPERVRTRLRHLAGHRLTTAGVIVITARRYRDQEQNRRDARERLRSLVQRACAAPKPRKKTRPSRAARERRLDAKRARAEIKRLRRSVAPGD